MSCEAASPLSAASCRKPHDHNQPGARDIADRLMASLGSMLLYWHHYAHHGTAHRGRNRRRYHRRRISCICCTARSPSASHVRAMHTSLILYAEHEFNASTFTARSIAGTGSDMYSAITGAIGALRGPKHGGANEVAFEIQKRYGDAGRGGSRYPAPDCSKGSRHRLRPSGLYDRRSAQQGHQGSRPPAQRRGRKQPRCSISPTGSRL